MVIVIFDSESEISQVVVRVCVLIHYSPFSSWPEESPTLLHRIELVWFSFTHVQTMTKTSSRAPEGGKEKERSYWMECHLRWVGTSQVTQPKRKGPLKRSRRRYVLVTTERKIMGVRTDVFS